MLKILLTVQRTTVNKLEYLVFCLMKSEVWGM